MVAWTSPRHSTQQSVHQTFSVAPQTCPSTRNSVDSGVNTNVDAGEEARGLVTSEEVPLGADSSLLAPGHPSGFECSSYHAGR